MTATVKGNDTWREEELGKEMKWNDVIGGVWGIPSPA